MGANGENTGDCHSDRITYGGALELRSLEEKLKLEIKRLDENLNEVGQRLKEEISAGDTQLLLHIQGQREQIRFQKEAVDAALVERDKQQAQADKARRDSANLVMAAQNKFETQVQGQFKTVNEFRGALDDLGKDMATRREIESLNEKFDERHRETQKTMAEFRSRLDIGPAGLANLQSGAAFSSGRQEGVSGTGKAIASMLATILVIIGIYTAFQATRNQSDRTPPVPTVTVTTPSRGP